MDMYSIMLRDRRITDYVLEQAYIWLYDQISMDNYVAGDRQSEKLILGIKQAGEVTRTSYNEFLKAFLNDPYQYLLICGKGKKPAGITSPELKNYFLKFNEEIIPVGFVESFFEDDYETREEIREFYDLYLDYNINQFGLNCQSISLSRSETLDNVKKSYPSVFKTKFSFHFTNLIKLVLVILGLSICIGFFRDIRIFESLDQLFTQGRSSTITDNMPVIIANVIFLIFLLTKVKECVRCIVFYVDLIQMRVRILLQKAAFNSFDADTIANFKDYFKSINAQLPSANYCISDEMCAAAPARRNQYLKIMNFNKETITKKLFKLTQGKKFYRKLHFHYSNDKDLAICKRFWKKGIVFTILVLIVFAFIDIPEWNAWIKEFFENVANDGLFEAIGEIFS